ncbi:LemA family protein [Bradyrhizobium stylosanthis]|uniref:LemA protein n=1 Tax=Bradyrhizobium stylosanthis TaxID=1803665 RepID=A0A560ECT2_9BRAD|nr:LemA family protein [Bradyrhizobium stylosanthis]TWB07183.1 hypothetical protein FBZ96_1011001 [Bradyrhizobium stylosanthis]
MSDPLLGREPLYPSGLRRKWFSIPYACGEKARTVELSSLFAVVSLLMLIIVGCSYDSPADRRSRATIHLTKLQELNLQRAELIPELIKICRGQVNDDLIGSVVSALDKVGQMAPDAIVKLSSDALSTHFEAQAVLSARTSELLSAAVENQRLKSNQAFLALQARIESLENSITIARHDYIQAAKAVDILH